MTKHTPGPWAWFGNAETKQIHLATVYGGRVYVMNFDRWGTHGAQPCFQVNGRMVNAKALLKFEVGDPNITGVEEAKKDDSVYRYDIRDIGHPDARLIAAAPDLLNAILQAMPLLEDMYHMDIAEPKMMALFREAIAKATGNSAPLLL